MRWIETYTWYHRLKENKKREWEFFDDWRNSAVVSLMNRNIGLVHAVGIGSVQRHEDSIPKLNIYLDMSLKHNPEEILSQFLLPSETKDVNIIFTDPFLTQPVRRDTFMRCGFRNSKFRPVPVGCGTMGVCENYRDIYGSPSGCSLGFFAVKDGRIVYISNNHCYHGSVCRPIIVCIGKYAVQPDTICDSNARENVIGTDVTTKEYSGTWLVDAAFAYATVDIAEGYLDADQQIKPFERITTRDPQPGETIVKHGRGVYTYSTRSATVESVGACVDVYCDYGVPPVRFCEQIITTYYLSGGDSGSGAYSQDMRNAVGLNFAGSSVRSVANRATLVERELGVRIIGKKQEGGAPSAEEIDPLKLIASLGGVVAGSVAFHRLGKRKK